MQYLNDYDIEFARLRFDEYRTPNRYYLTNVVANLAQWADSVSDGWAYWPKPCRAAQRAIALIESTTSAADDRQEREDATIEETKAALRPIKSFLTRQGVSHEVLL